MPEAAGSEKHKMRGKGFGKKRELSLGQVVKDVGHRSAKKLDVN